MAYTDAFPQWNYRMPAGSLQEIGVSFDVTSPASVAPWPISGAPFEYIVRSTATDTGTPVFVITTTANAAGVIAVTATATQSSALISIYPAATAGLAPGTYFHALWMSPGTNSAYAWFTGNLLIQGNPQP